jgi:hypothetical protein
MDGSAAPTFRLLLATALAGCTVIAGLSEAGSVAWLTVLAILAVVPLTVGLWAVSEEMAPMAGLAFAVVGVLAPTFWLALVLNLPLLVVALSLVAVPTAGGSPIWVVEPDRHHR